MASCENLLADKMGWEFFPVMPYVKWFKEHYSNYNSAWTYQPRAYRKGITREVIQCDCCKYSFRAGEFYVTIGHISVCPDVGDACLYREAVRS